MIEHRIAMWSGPRNISTALMRAWENRGDTAVVDEPLYAYYLHQTGLDHPGRAEIIASGETNWHKVVALLTGPIPDNQPIFYQKHMTHHLLAAIDRHWLRQVTNIFLIRDPREVILSYAKTRPTVTLDDIGIRQQADIFAYVQQLTGQIPLVIDSSDFLHDPRGQLSALCALLDIPFTERMLAWPAGSRASDGIWAPYWYAAVQASTGFEPYRPRSEQLPVHLEPLAATCRPYYDILYQYRLPTATTTTFSPKP